MSTHVSNRHTLWMIMAPIRPKASNDETKESNDQCDGEIGSILPPMLYPPNPHPFHNLGLIWTQFLHPINDTCWVGRVVS